MNFDNVETITIQDQLARYEQKTDINKSDAEFQNLVDKIAERKIPGEIISASNLLLKFGDVRRQKMENETNPYKKKSFPAIIIPYYQRAIDLASPIVDTAEITKVIKELKEFEAS